MCYRLIKAAANVLTVALCLVATGASHAAQPRKFLTFSSALSNDWVKSHGAEYVFVWGESDGDTRNPDRARVWATYAPHTLLSTYFPYGRDPARRPPSEWLSSHPDWILYQCDGKSMATLFGHPIVPLDISNPAVERWQIQNFAAAEHSVVALDNFSTHNVEHACGVERDGQYVGLYSANSGGQQKFAETKVTWLEHVAKAMHDQKKTVTINYQIDLPVGSPLLDRIVDATDAILDEEVYPAHAPDRFLKLATFASVLQSRHKPLYTIYEVQAVTPNNVESAMAAYLIYAGANGAVDITGMQQYGGARNYFGYDRNIGEPCEPYRYADGFFTRRYTQGLTVMRDPTRDVAAYKPDAGFVDVDGKPAGQVYPLAPAQGLVLYRPKSAACLAPTGVTSG